MIDFIPKRPWLSLVCLVQGLFLFSCSDKETWYPLPENSSVVITIDPERITKKVILDKLGDFNFLDLFDFSDKKDSAKQQDELASILNAPDDVGIDIFENFYLFKKDHLIGVFASLKDHENFSDHLKNGLKKKITSLEGHSVTYIDSIAIAWTKDHCLFLFKSDLSLTNLEELKYVLTTQKEKSIFNNPHFINSIAYEADVTVWCMIPELLKEYYSVPEFTKGLFPNKYSTAYLNFEEGEITISLQDFLKPEVVQLLKMPSIETRKYKKSFFVPDSSFSGTINIDVSKLITLVQKDSIEKKLQEFQITPHDISETLTGAILFTSSGLNQLEKKYSSYSYDDDFNKIETVETTKIIYPSFTTFFATNDSSKAEKLLQSLSSKGLIDKKEDYFEFSLTEIPIYIYNNSQGITITEKSKSNVHAHPLIDSNYSSILLKTDTSKNPIYIYSYPGKFVNDLTNYGQKNILLDHIQYVGLKISKNTSNAFILTSEIKLKKSDQNSLLTLIEIFKESRKHPL